MVGSASSPQRRPLFHIAFTLLSTSVYSSSSSSSFLVQEKKWIKDKIGSVLENLPILFYSICESWVLMGSNLIWSGLVERMLFWDGLLRQILLPQQGMKGKERSKLNMAFFEVSRAFRGWIFYYDDWRY
jgi:hypothetical protein